MRTTNGPAATKRVLTTLAGVWLAGSCAATALGAEETITSPSAAMMLRRMEGDNVKINVALIAEQVVSAAESDSPRRPLEGWDCTGDFDRKLKYLDKAEVSGYWLYGFRSAEGTMRDIGLLKAAKAKLERLGKEAYIVCEPLGHPDPNQKALPAKGWRYRINCDGKPDLGCADIEENLIRDLVAATTAFRDAGFKKVFFDDDLRMGEWGTNITGCFCEACLADFNRRQGTRHTREDLRRFVQNPGEHAAICEAWMDFNCEKVTAFMKAVNLPGIQVGIMVMHNGDRKHGIDLPALLKAVPNCLVRVGEGMFDDASFDPPGGKAFLIQSLEMHKAIVKDVSRLYSENTVHPPPNLRPENMAKKLLIEVEHGLRNIMLMPPWLIDQPAYWEAIAAVLPEAKALAAKQDEPGPLKMKNAWYKEHLTGGKSSLPFSFTYDGRPSAPLLAEWPVKAAEERLDAHRTRRTLTWTDPKTGLEIRCVAVDYADYPAVEWTVWFRNTGTTNTPIIEDIQGLNARYDAGEKREFVLHGIKGDFQSPESYEPYRLVLSAGSTANFGPRGPIWGGDGSPHPLGSSLGMPGTGKPSDGPDGWPYFNLQTPGGGTIIAVGWPGQWAASFARDAATSLTVRAGQELTHLSLKPGEEIRTPLIALLFWQGGDVVEAQNLWRRWYRAHNLPRIEGKPQPAVTFFSGIGTEDELPVVQSWLDAGIHLDVFWRDAGGAREHVWWTLGPDPLPYPWPGMYWMNSGTWTPDPKKFPRGFKPVSDWLRARGVQFMLWFEPERVGDPNSWLGKNHPEWLLPNDNLGSILNEGNPAARQWLTDHISGMIESQGLDWYREDMNGGGPLPAWRKNDTPSRQGITENLHVQGHLMFWDELRRRYPHLRIDSCASGGRRNDLESMRRAVPLLRSDYTMGDSNMADKQSGVIEGNQCHTYGLSAWLPFHGTYVSTPDLYAARSHYVPCFGAGVQLTPENQAAVRRVYDECRQVAPLVLEGDYYPLTPYSRASSDWLAWQFNRPEKGDGVVQVFRRAESPYVRADFRLRGLDPAAIYEVRNFDAAGSTKVSGQDLMEKGLPVELKGRPGSAVFTYKSGVTAAIASDYVVGEQPLPVRFDGRGSSCSSGKIVSYEWDFGDGATSREATPAHTYGKPGRYTAKLTVTDDQKRRDTATISVNVTPEDTVAPTLASVAAPGRPDRVRVVFSEPVNQADAETASNYVITPGIRVLAAALGADRRTVTLTTSSLGAYSARGTDYTLSVKGIRDCGRRQNVLAADTRQTFRFEPLFAHWPLNEGKGLVAADASGSKLAGALKGGPAWTNLAGRAGLRFDGADDVVELPTRLENLAVPFALAFWVNPADKQSEYAAILGNSEDTFGLVLQQDGNNTNRMFFGYCDGDKGCVAGPLQLTADVWQHVAIVCDGEKILCHIDGEEKLSAPAKGELAASTNLTFRLGQGSAGKRFFRGLLSDVRIYRQALSPADVQAVMKETGEGGRR